MFLSNTCFLNLQVYPNIYWDILRWVWSHAHALRCCTISWAAGFLRVFINSLNGSVFLDAGLDDSKNTERHVKLSLPW